MRSYLWTGSAALYVWAEGLFLFHYMNVSVLLEVSDGGLSYLLLHRQITTPRNSFFKTTIILHWCMRFGFIQGVAIWEKDIVAAI